MKKIFYVLLSGTLIFTNNNLRAQNFVNGGNNLNAIGRLGTTSNQSLAFITSNTERARLTNSGNFGIGTGIPVTRLHVNGFGSFGNRVTSSNAIRALNLVDDNAVMRVLRVDPINAPSVELISRTSADGANVAYWDFYAQPSDATFRIRDRQYGGAGLDRLTISHASGNVGIGTTTPQFSLDVQKAGAVIGQFKSTGLAGVIIDKGTAGTNEYVIHRTGGVDKWTEGTIGNNDFSLHNWSLGGDALTVDISNNNIGVGTTSPSAKLHVVGSTTAGTGILATGYSYGLRASATGSGYGVYGSSSYIGVYGYSSGSNYGVYGSSGYLGTYGSGTSYGTYGYSYAGTGATGYSSTGTGVYGYSSSGNAIYGASSSSTGVNGSSTDGLGGRFYSTNYYGIRAGTGNSAGNWAGVFDGNVYSFGAFQTSDRNLKKNITDVSDAISIINKLKPKNYEFRNDDKLASLHLPKGSHYGLIAQDLQEVLPNLISEVSHDLKRAAVKPIAEIKPTADGKPVPVTAAETRETKETIETINIKSVNYVELIPIIIKAMQEQQTTIDKQNSKIEELTQLVNQLSQNTHSGGSVKLSSLGLATPNPAANNTKITYNIPSNTIGAILVINNEAGQKVKQLPLDKSGMVNIDTSGLITGTYFYTLVINGASVDTKKMVVNR